MKNLFKLMILPSTLFFPRFPFIKQNAEATLIIPQEKKFIARKDVEIKIH